MADIREIRIRGDDVLIGGRKIKKITTELENGSVY